MEEKRQHKQEKNEGSKKKNIPVFKILIGVTLLSIYVWVQDRYQPELDKKQSKPKRKVELPLREAAKSLNPGKNLSDEDVKELFCARICSAQSSGRW